MGSKSNGIKRPSDWDQLTREQQVENVLSRIKAHANLEGLAAGDIEDIFTAGLWAKQALSGAARLD